MAHSTSKAIRRHGQRQGVHSCFPEVLCPIHGISTGVQVYQPPSEHAVSEVVSEVGKIKGVGT